jgi:hypothetical protein
MRHKLSYRIFLSEKLKEKVLELIIEYPPEINNFKRDKLLYFLSLITELPARNKRGAMHGNGYTLINATILKKYLRNYKEYIDYLKHHMIVVCDNHFIPREKSFGYKLMPEYVDKVKPAYIQNPELVRKLNKQKLENLQNLKKYKHLKKWFDDLEIDYKGAYDYIRAQYGIRVLNPETRDWDNSRAKYKEPIDQYNNALINLNYIKDGKIFFFVDEIAGRLHTNLTNMPSDLRNFITCKGQKLGSVDITNSQPYLSSVLFRPSFYKNYAVGSDENLSLFSFSGGFSFSPAVDLFTSSNVLGNLTYVGCSSVAPAAAPPLMLPKPPQLTDQKDVMLFLDLVEKGQFYEYMEEVFSREWGEEYGTRNAVKAAIFLVLFTNNRFIGQDEAKGKRLFKKIFPNVYKLFAAYKKCNSNGLPVLLQRIEAKLILDVIAKRIAKEMPRIPIYTIHDSITTTVEHLDYVQQVMREELGKYIGIEPKFKVEYWDTSNLNLTSNFVAEIQA